MNSRQQQTPMHEKEAVKVEVDNLLNEALELFKNSFSRETMPTKTELIQLALLITNTRLIKLLQHLNQNKNEISQGR